MNFRALSLAACLAFAGIGAVWAQDVAQQGQGGEVPLTTVGAPETVATPVAEDPTIVAGIDLAEWAAFAALAEGIVEPATATSFALTRVRSELVPWRDRFSNALGVNAARLSTLDRQIAALTPAEGVTETDPVILKRLDQLAITRTRLAQPRLLALEAHARADGLISEIDAQVRKRETKRLMSRGESPANPAYWPDALAALTGGVKSIAAEIIATTKVFEDDGRLMSRLLTVLGAVFAATAFVFYVRFWLAKLAAREVAKGARLRSVLRFVISVARVILPVIGIAILVGILQESGFFGLTGLAVIAVFPIAGALIFYTKWLADKYFPRAAEVDGILGYDLETRTKGRFYAVALGRVLALNVLVEALSSATRASAVSLDVINLPFQLIIGWLLWRLGCQIVHKSSHQPAVTATRVRVRNVVGRGAQIFAVAGPLASLLGFGAAAQAITGPAVVSLAILATIVVIQRLNSEVMSRAGTPVDDEAEQGVIDRSGLWPVVVNFAVVMLSLPVFALIWGASSADLAEVWTRFLNGFSIGGSQISPTSFLTFVMVFAIGYIITGFVKTSLKTSVLPRTQLDLGGQNAIVAGTGYFGIFLAALIGFSVAGIDLSSLAIVAGALSVGIGFGLQNIVSNFVSGIILLIERPVSEGDMIEVGGQMGYVRDISVRSTRIETFDRIDVIIPNADLVSGQVSNWTRGNLVGRAIVAVGVAYGTDTAKVARILQEIAEANPIVVMNPPPSVLLMRFGADSVDFEIRAIIRDVNFVNIAKSEMFHEIVRRFAEEGIEIPFAQRDIWLRNPEVLHPKGEPE